MDVDIKELKRLIQLVENADISAFKIETGDIKVEIEKKREPAHVQAVVAPAAVAPPVASTPVTAPANEPVAEAESRDPNLVAIKSPMVGTFYLSANPESPPYVAAGDSVKSGDVICIIEAMKLFNEIESEFSGKIEKVLVDNASPVEYGQELFLVRQ